MFIKECDLYVFISVGSEHKMFTLRVMQKGYDVFKGIEYVTHNSMYIKNLSTNIEDAIEKAQAFSLNSGLPFKVSTDQNIGLFNITRLTKEELDHRKWEEEQERLNNEALLLEKANLLHEELSMLTFTIESKCSFGKYRHKKTIAEMINDDPEYICWLYDNNELPFKRLKNTFNAQLNWIYANVPRPVINPVVSGWLADNEGEKLTDITALCTGAYHRQMNIGYGRMTTVYEYELTEANTGKQIIINYSGDKWDMDANKTYKFDGKIKQLAEWHSVKRTILNYVKNVQEI